MSARRRAFTLVELLVVVGIIAALVALLLPALRRARIQANILKCMSGERQAYLAVMMYCNDYHHYYPTGTNDYTQPMRDPLWHVKLTTLGYMKEATQTSRGGCPDGPSKFYTYYEGGDYYTHPNVFDEMVSWAGAPAPARASYGLNGLLQSGIGRLSAWPWQGPYGQQRRVSPFVRRHETDIGLIFCTAVPWSNSTVHLYPAVSNTVGQDPTPYLLPWGIPVAGRHAHKGIPILYCDGHAGLVDANAITTIFNPDRSKPLMWWSEYYLYWSYVMDSQTY